jgi:hemerythrin
MGPLEDKMALVKWDQSFSVKVKRYDEDHQKLFAMINTLHESMLAGKGGEKIQEVVKQLADYTKYHFAAEEAELAKAKYPGRAAHRAEHEAFVKKVEQFQQDIAAGKVNLSISVGGFLNDWLTNHIKRTDQQYGAFLNQHGVS